MKAVIPAAGHGTRFRPVTDILPKEMLIVAGRPAIAHIVDEACAAGADEVVIVTSRTKPAIEAYFKAEKDYADKVRFAYQEEQKGLGHAVLQAAGVCAGETEGILVLLGDALVSGEAPAPQMAALSREHGSASVIGLEEVPLESVSRYGIAKTDETGRILDLMEKPRVEEAPSRLAVAGRYLLDPAIFKLLETQTPGAGGEIQLTDAIRRLLATHAAYGYRYPGRRIDIGRPAGYMAARLTPDLRFC